MAKKNDIKKLHGALTKSTEFISRHNTLLQTKIDNFSTGLIMKVDPLKKSVNQLFHKLSDNRYYQIFNKFVNKNSMYIILIFMFALFGGMTQGSSLLPSNIISVLISQNAYIIIMGFGMLLVIVSGNIDLSVGSLLGFYGILSLVIQRSFNSLLLTTVLISLLSLGVGFFQGFLIGYIRIPSFIITLGGMLLFRGLQQFIASQNNGSVAAPHFIENWQYFFNTSISDAKAPGDITFYYVSFIVIFLVGLLVIGASILNRWRQAKSGARQGKLVYFVIGNVLKLLVFTLFAIYVAMSSGGLELWLIYLIIIMLVFYFISTKTVLGRNIFSVGGNRKAAELSGVNAKKTTLKVFILMSLLTAVASLFLINSVQVGNGTIGNGEELNVIASVFVGGASAYGGIGSIVNTLIGSLVLSSINNGLDLLQTDANLRYVVKGVVLIIAVTYDVLSKKRTA